jgi:hypothetical protein
MYKVYFFDPTSGKMLENVMDFKLYSKAYAYGHANYSWTRWIVTKVG